MSLSDLLAEAIEEQENSIPFNRLSVYNRLLDFRNYLIDNLKGNSVSSNFSKIKTFYRYNRIDIPFIPPINSKALVKYDAISFDDLLTKEEIIKAVETIGLSPTIRGEALSIEKFCELSDYFNK